MEISREVDQILGVGEPRVVDVPVEVREINERFAVLKFKNYAIFVKKLGKGYRVSIWSEKDGKVVPECTKEISLLELDGLDIDQNLREILKAYISSWDTLLEKRLAEIVLTGDIKAVPRAPSDKEVLAYEIAKKLVEDLNACKLKMRIGAKVTSLGIYCYDGTVWYQCEEKVRSAIGSYLQSMQVVRATRGVVSEVIENKIEMINTKLIDASEDRPRIAFNNYVLDWDAFLETGDIGKAITRPSPDIYVFHRIPHNLSPNIVKEIRRGLEVFIPPRTSEEVLTILRSLTPRTYDLLKSWAYYNNIGEDLLKSRIAFLLEIIGRAMLPGYRVRNTIAFKDIFVLLGPSNSGKSTFLVRFMCGAVLGEENCRTTKLRYLGTDDEETLWRTLGQLHNVLAVVLPDVGKKDRASDWSTIRSISGGDYVQARRLRENPFQYYPHYKFYIASNDPPPINETGDAKQALLNRIKAMEFKNVFTENPEFTLSSILSEEDIEVLILCALYALRLAYLRGCKYSFTGVYDVEDLLNRYTYPEYRLVMEMIERGLLTLNPSKSISSRDLYNMVVNYSKNMCKEDRLEKEDEADSEEEEECLAVRIPSQNQFTMNLRMLLARFGVRTVSKSHQTYFKGIGVG